MRLCQRQLFLIVLVELLSLLFSANLLYAQSGTLFGQGTGAGQGFGQSQGLGPSQGLGQTQGNGQNQPYGQGQMQTSGQSLGISSSAPNGLTPQAMLKIMAENPDLASEVKVIVLDRLKQQGRMPPGGQLTPAFVMNEIQNDAALKAQLVQLLQHHGLLPLSATGMGGQANTVPSGTMQGGFTTGMPPGGTNPAGNNGLGAATGPLANTQPSTSQPSTPVQPAPTAQAVTAPTANQEQEKPKAVITTPYGDLQSLQGLYTQVPEDNTDLKRFGMDVFTNGTGNTEQLPADLPAGPDYMLGSGDALNIHLWGGIEQELSETIDRSGRIELPSTRSIMVAGQTLERAQEAIRNALAGQFKNVKVDISLSRVRTVRVYVVGDVQHPGAYDISSLSTPLSALFAAGGPTEQGSLRQVKHMRAGKVVANLDLYDLLLNGVNKAISKLEPGDSILVSPVGPQITVAGLVRRPAIYEVNSGADLASTIELAGGLQVSASMEQVNVDRVEAHKRHLTMNLQIPLASDTNTIKELLGSFRVQDGDRVTISSILPNREDTVFLEGHVFRPGKRAFKEGMRVSDLIHSYQDLLPEASEHAEIIRLEPPEYNPVVIELRTSEIFSPNHPIPLQPFDTVRIFGRYELDAPIVTINGEVQLPGQYPMARKMTISELVRLAGGFRRSAYLQQADLSSYVVKNGERVLTEHKTVRISEAVNGNADADITLKPGDVITVRQLTGWADIGASITLSGEVMHPGTYGIGIGEKLSSLLERAGGFRDTAFPQGAKLERLEVRNLAEQSKQALMDRIETEGLTMSFNATSASTMAGQDSGKDAQSQLQAMMMQQKQVLDTLRSHPASGRLVIEISAEIKSWKNTPMDVELRDGDELTIPKRSDIIMVNGQVYNPSAMTYIPGRTVEWYLRSAGGFTELANKHGIFVVRANGAVLSKGGKSLGSSRHGDVMSARVKPGDIIIAPEKTLGGSVAWRNFMALAQTLSGMAITARVATSF